MGMRIGDTVRLKAGSKDDDPARELAGRPGVVGDIRDDAGVMRLNVFYGEVGLLLTGVAAADFEPVVPPVCPPA